MPTKMEDFGFWLSRVFARTDPSLGEWPFIPGTYFVSNPQAPVAVCTLGSVDLAPLVASNPPAGLCITGKVETENIGIEKIVKNLNANPAVRYLLCVGQEPPKHLTGATMQALFENGIDEQNRIPGSPGMRPCLPNTSAQEVEQFRSRIQPVYLIGCMDVGKIHAKVNELANLVTETAPVEIARPSASEVKQAVEQVVAQGEDPLRIKLDKAGYFVVNIVDNVIRLEHYSYKEEFLRIITGQDARSIYLTLIRNGWVTKLDHAAYLGKELTKAELSLEHGFEYRQDGA